MLTLIHHHTHHMNHMWSQNGFTSKRLVALPKGQGVENARLDLPIPWQDVRHAVVSLEDSMEATPFSVATMFLLFQ